MDIDSLLAKVRRPSRYLGGEVNSRRKPWNEADVRFCLAFPDVYEVGMSHVGLQILYNILNSERGTLADRVFAPWVDMEQAMREADVPLWGLETRRPVREFGVLGITLPYELTYTNILTILNLSELPFYSSERGGDFPLVLGGGIGAFNPGPIEPFFDAFLLGDGEDATLSVSDAVRKNRSRRDLLRELAKIRGVYVPGISTSVHRAVFNGLDAEKYVGKPVVPFMQVVHDRVGVEIQRGCARGCRFCQAGFTYRPVRKRGAEDIVRLSDEGIAASGHEELSFLSLSAGDHEGLPEILRNVSERYGRKWVNISLPSLRVETLTPDILRVLQRALHGGFTLAPEAGTERLRRVINKGNTEADLLETIDRVFAAGWRQLKLYFMIGLPTETDEDVMAIAALSHKAFDIGKRRRRDASLTVSVSTFVPKPHTPFQWAGQISVEETLRRQNILKAALRRRGIEFKWHGAEASFLEGVFSRGDARLAPVILSAWKNGARFDAWDEQFKPDVWKGAFAGNGIDAANYLRAREAGEPLPWGHLFVELDRDFLRGEFERALGNETSLPCSEGACNQCGLIEECAQNDCFRNPPSPRGRELEGGGAKKITCISPLPSPLPQGERGFSCFGNSLTTLGTTTLRFTFTKLDSARWLSHLELMQVFRRAFRRAGLPVKYSEGFHPHMKLSLEKALKVGEASENENGRVELFGGVDVQSATEKINLELPLGIRIKSIV